jgi:hypothetical protein
VVSLPIVAWTKIFADFAAWEGSPHRRGLLEMITSVSLTG